MIVLAELLGEHQELERLADGFKAIVRAPVPDAAAVAAVRWQLVRAFIDHWEREDRLVYDLLLASGDARATALTWAFRQEFGTLREEMRRYVTEWPVDRISREWQAFQEHTFGLATRVDARREQEEKQLYPQARRVIGRRAA